MFFDRDYDKGITWYADYYSGYKLGQLCGEIAPTYFDVKIIPVRIQAINPDCKIIINLRHPARRALSLYHHHLGKGRVQGSFSDAVSRIPRIIEAGKYASHISRWLNTFGKEQMLLILLEDIESHPEQILKHIYQFLGIDAIEMPELGHEKFGAAVMPKFPKLAKIAAESATWLRRHRLHKIAELGKALGFKKVYTGDSKTLPTLTSKECSTLLENYEEDIVFVEKFLGRDLSTWREV